MQITFYSSACTNGFRIVTVNSSRYRDQRLQQNQQNVTEECISNNITGCIVERTRNARPISSTCHTAVIVRLRANQVLAVATVEDSYYKPMLMKEYLTYWGLYKIA